MSQNNSDTGPARSDSALPPPLSMPSLEAGYLEEAYSRATRIVEYGMGGSTVLAAQMAGKTLWSVESDPEWVARIEGYFSGHPPRATLHLRHVDIGPVGEWGMPAGQVAWRKYAQYPLAVWDENPDPDLVFVDGRFRVGCVLAALLCARRPLTLLFDDYLGRERYRAVEQFAQPVEMLGRMARFEITPRPIDGSEVLTLIELMQRPL